MRKSSTMPLPWLCCCCCCSLGAIPTSSDCFTCALSLVEYATSPYRLTTNAACLLLHQFQGWFKRVSNQCLDDIPSQLTKEVLGSSETLMERLGNMLHRLLETRRKVWKSNWILGHAEYTALICSFIRCPCMEEFRSYTPYTVQHKV